MNFHLLKENFDNHVKSLMLENLFGKVKTQYLNIAGQDGGHAEELSGENEPTEVSEDLAGAQGLKYKHLEPDELGDKITKAQDLEPSKQAAQAGLFTVQMNKIRNENDQTWDLDKLKAIITRRPNDMLLQNEKMKHGSGEFVKFYNVGMPAIRALVFDESAQKWAIVTTCPGAGGGTEGCLMACYGTHGNFIRVPNTYLSRAQRLNFYLNDPAGFEKRLGDDIAKMRLKLDKDEKKLGIVIKMQVRWHDAGDFFSEDYLGMAKRIAEKFPNIWFYAYTKVSNAVLSKFPSNFLTRFSMGANPTEIGKMGDMSKHYHAFTVPYDLFKDLFARKGAHFAKDSTNAWASKEPAAENAQKLKERVAQKYKLNINDVLLHDEYMDNYTSLDKTTPKYHVILYTGKSDLPASEVNVRAVYNLEH